MKAWITRYALTVGIAEVDGETLGTGAKMLKWSHPGSVGSAYSHGNDWHKTREAAIARAEEMRIAKIDRLKKSIAKLEKLKFE